LLLKVFFHDRCFDGTASAALFGRFYRDVVAADAKVLPVGVTHRDGDPFEGVKFDADDHACVDFRFSPADEMRWWFDHHKTAFQPPALRAVFELRRSPTQWFDPEAPSCTGLIARVLGERYGWTPPPALAELVRWADIIDAADFATAEEASSLSSPAQRLAMFLGATPSDADVLRYIEALGDGATIAELDETRWVRAVTAPLLEGRERMAALLATVGEVVAGDGGDVVLFDLLDHPELPNPGFVGYALFPRCRYAIAASRAHGAIKIAVGYNPWCGLPRAHDIGALCQRHGGGGHAVVGGVTLEPDEQDRARATIAALVGSLRRAAAA
jgi:hypothetical protein